MSRYKRPDKHFQDCVAALSEKPPKRRITDAQITQMVWDNSQCVKDQTGHCPLLIFGKQLADAVNSYFYDDDEV